MIIICDDDEDINCLLVNTLSEKYIVKSYEYPIDLLKNIKIEKPHLYIVDLKLPGMDGSELTEKILYKHWDVPVLIISGVYPVKLNIKKKPTSQVFFISKPFDLSLITGMIDTILSENRNLEQFHPDVVQ